ncbi:universal stress protein [Methanosphaera sp.]|uniref:universal stress protein n=1 Tax=Methanosphaera sp. TaxID=2666342 RepID=UPI0026E05141|nr:universal stress protein [Methanosphaera sp.]MDO5821732.1 universal stress protein [Methanosphaera sp.]
MFKRILLPIDGSENSKKAADKAIELAKELNSTIIVTNIMDQSVDLSYNEQEVKSNEFIKKIVDLILKNNINVESMVLFGSPTYDIVTIARKSESDSIIMGKQGINYSNSRVIGSFTEATLKNVDLPIILI